MIKLRKVISEPEMYLETQFVPRSKHLYDPSSVHWSKTHTIMAPAMAQVRTKIIFQTQ